MSGRKPRTSRTLLLLSVLLCLFIGASVTQSSGSLITDASIDDTYMLVAEKKENPADAVEETTPPKASVTATPIPEETAVPTASPAETNTSSVSAYDSVSPEATQGVWRPDGSHWRFLINGTPHTGWLNDTDGKRYFFNSDGIMQTGLVDYENKRYYFDADGVLQTGDVVINGKTYHFLEDGSLEGYVVDKATSAKKQKTENASDDKPAAEETPTPEATPAPKTTLTPQATPTPLPQTEGAMALTFDDGPGAYTDRLLDCLESTGAKATFFLVGQEISDHPEAVKRMASLGCEVGGHSYTHTDMTLLTADDIIAEVWATNQEIESLTGQPATVFRPPYSTIDDNILSNAKNPIILSSASLNDKEAADAKALAESIINAAADGAILELHDTNEITVAACEIAIPQLTEMGVRLLTVHELAAEKGVELTNGTTYSSITAS
jgi:peptidoglycan/xylan/chitin deacetylase (PgdA/CDA1 family)